MVRAFGSPLGRILRGAVPFFLITVVWSVIMLVFYGVFLLTKPAGVEYGAVVHGSVFLPPLVGFLGHVLREALRAG